MRNMPFYTKVVLFILLTQTSFAATFTVTSNADNGAGTLRQAIIDANALAGADIIEFNFPGATTITLSTCLTSITSPLTINGYSNPGSGAGNILIEVISPTGCNGFEFAAGSDGSVLRGINISGGSFGIYMHNSNDHTVSGNYVGTNRTGTAVATNRPQNGIHAYQSNNNIIGGTGGQIDRNIVSGNSQSGIRIRESTGTVIINNYVGTSVTGNAAIANGEHGVYIFDSSHATRVGGTTTAERNVISANTSHGIYIYNCSTLVIKGNIIGMGLDGTTKLGNGASGINGEYVPGCQIGGITTSERNYLSCNGSFGAVVRYSNNAVFEGNWIGVDMATGNLDYGNYDAGITVTNSADVRIGGSVAGAGNISSANGNPGGGADGFSIWSSSPRPIIKGNLVGVGADGVTPLQNYGHGIECLTCDDGLIGGPLPEERNIISVSLNRGIQLVNSPRVTVANNYIGTDITGLLDRGGNEMGIAVSNSANVLIGGTAANTGNVICGNAGSGIEIDGTSPSALVKGNYIGVGSDGNTAIRNDQFGVKISGNLTINCVIGGSTTQERNIISSNGTNSSHHAISIGGNSSGHSVINNYIGTNISGTVARGNFGHGIYINACNINTITDNIISNNSGKGIEFANSSSNTVYRNKIGTDISNSLNFGNSGEGIRFSSTSNNNVIGGSEVNANIIANNNQTAGLLLESNAQRNTITFNSIYCNVGPGIDLQGTSNESVLPPGVSSSTANSISGTGTNGNIIHAYRNVTADGGVKCNCEGEIYIGTTVVAGGTWSITHNLGLTATEATYATATQTTPNGSTSEFTNCSTPLPVTLLSFTGTKTDAHTTSLHWSTSYEHNNSHFVVQRSSDGINFENLEIIPGAGNSNEPRSYVHEDRYANDGIHYYRLMQVDVDGRISYSQIILVDFSNRAIVLVPEENGFSIVVSGQKEKEISYNVYSVNGSTVSEGTVELSAGEYKRTIILPLNEAVYVVTAVYEGQVTSIRIKL